MKRITGHLVSMIWLLAGSAASASNLYDVDYRTETLVVDEGSYQELELNFRRWYRDDAQAVIVYLSGLQSHSQWFNDTGDYLHQSGYNVYALDRRGSGLSAGRRGYAGNYMQWVGDLDELIAQVQAENPSVPIHLMANCFGTRITMKYAMVHPDKIDSLILLAPGTHLQVSPPPAQKFEILFHYWREFETPLKDELFTDDADKLDFLAQDDLGLRKASAHFYKLGELLKSNILLPHNLAKLNIPILVMLSNIDRIIDPPAVIKGFFEKLNTDKKIVIYDQAEHFLLFEEVRDNVLWEVEDWIASFAE